MMINDLKEQEVVSSEDNGVEGSILQRRSVEVLLNKYHLQTLMRGSRFIWGLKDERVSLGKRREGNLLG